MIDRLPYQLTKGVTATNSGLWLDDWDLADYLNGSHETERIISWPDAAERLRYREGEPWCYTDARELEWPHFSTVVLRSNRATFSGYGIYIAFHRLAAILCDDAEAFRVLHACIEEFAKAEGGGDD